MGTSRRVWGRRGIKVRQRIQMVREWRYLHLVLDPQLEFLQTHLFYLFVF